MNLKKALIACAAGAGALSLALAALPTAQADPPAGTYRALSGVGSDTIMDVMQAMSAVVAVNGALTIGSYDASTSTDTFQTKADAKCTYQRAAVNGSTAGITALAATLAAGSTTADCLQFARSSSGKKDTSPTGLTWIPFGKDAVTFAVRSDGTVAKALTQAQLVNIYKCGDTSIVPVLPQAGSGTRSFWLGKIGVTETDITSGTYPCLLPASMGGTGVEYMQEHDGRALLTNEIMPFSIAQWQAQASGVAVDRRGMTVLGTLDDQAPTVINQSTPFTRDVFNVVPTTKITDTNSTEYKTFAGKTSPVCQQTTIITKFGFGTIGDRCGDTSSRS